MVKGKKSTVEQKKFLLHIPKKNYDEIEDIANNEKRDVTSVINEAIEERIKRKNQSLGLFSNTIDDEEIDLL